MKNACNSYRTTFLPKSKAVITANPAYHSTTCAAQHLQLRMLQRHGAGALRPHEVKHSAPKHDAPCFALRSTTTTLSNRRSRLRQERRRATRQTGRSSTACNLGGRHRRCRWRNQHTQAVTGCAPQHSRNRLTVQRRNCLPAQRNPANTQLQPQQELYLQGTHSCSVNSTPCGLLLLTAPEIRALALYSPPDPC